MIARRTPITGNSRTEKPLFPDFKSPAIAHNELVASARFVTFDVPEREFPRESPAAALEISVSTKKKNLRAWRSGALPATTTPLTASIQSDSALGSQSTKELRGEKRCVEESSPA
jgi:hypothetical protein